MTDGLHRLCALVITHRMNIFPEPGVIISSSIREIRMYVSGKIV